MRNKRAQLTAFIIIAIIIIASGVLYFVFRDSLTVAGIPPSIEPVYNNFLSCLEEDIFIGIDLLESQGGYIEIPDFEPGSHHMPFSSQLDFLGNPIPYWYYVSGNNIQKILDARIKVQEHGRDGRLLDRLMEEFGCKELYDDFSGIEYELKFDLEMQKKGDSESPRRKLTPHPEHIKEYLIGELLSIF